MVGRYGRFHASGSTNLILQRTRKHCGPGTRGRAMTFKDPPLETFFSYYQAGGKWGWDASLASWMDNTCLSHSTEFPSPPFLTSHLVIRRGSTMACLGLPGQPWRQLPFRISFTWRASFSKTLEGRKRGDWVDAEVHPKQWASSLLWFESGLSPLKSL